MMATVRLKTQVAWLMFSVDHCINGLIVCEDQQNPSKNQHDHCHCFLVYSIVIVLGTDGDIFLQSRSGNVAEVA